MANLFHNFLANGLGIFLISLSTTIVAQEAVDVAPANPLPINLDAESSEFDRKKNKLLFHDLTIKQGLLSIKADEATATHLDFENMRWEFSGKVIIENAHTTTRCDYADIRFREHLIRSAVMKGQPVMFTQLRINEERQTEGHANHMEYDIDAGIIKLTGDSWLSDGANEVSGNRISYDLNREFIIADADDDGQVSMKIIPPESSLSKIEDQINP
ncbi:MAG: lipopolysaccharide transport periplasmic protein LptA [Gammaproteobacteria bacterium]|jgi:lipopolysaccharide transport protein LptA|nr:lipopolysaccharide transport periplasmic protein LptA [Gammaproteobacteria bacterium]MDP7154388.1 lipopolysaccharide transport periplasmic protein LptA [Gammaproteobacteria bacterium]MDP7295889.1 lipopolysaccharide transport periplasmic protein LptA [Gammaproteobacteria bacterium]MDP7419862.1 lipopolysaccharide transport periplasmic protein LptA [Gammaproteobacteria bacterium]MDP7661224.1 lipopolysaccharide transport periplasmic protein LptA [Gammaproteobacteria bacterium]